MKNARRRTPYFRLWWAFFAYSAIVALLIQLVVLPYLFPQWHAGDGLLIGGDWLMHHRLAVELAEKIRSQGWGAWTLRPHGQATGGIAGAIYALTVPKPWTLIPLNAALHATAALVLLMILQFFIPNWRRAIWAVLPFFLYPSTLLWTTQILKDGYSIAGFLLFVYGWLVLIRLETWRRVRWLPILPLAWIMLGGFLIWVVRPYLLQVMQIIGAVVVLLSTIIALRWALKKAVSWRVAVTSAVLFWGIVASLSVGTQWGEENGILADAPTADAPTADAPTPTQVQAEDEGRPVVKWEDSGWVPKVLEDMFYSVAVVRGGFIVFNPDAASNIDTNTPFNKVYDVIAYSPRAVQIAFFSPFPRQWFGSGSVPTSKLMRRVSVVEMIGVWVALVFLLYALWRWRRRPEFWVLTSFCFGLMVAYGLVVTNVGSLYRLRYGFLMTLVAVGIAGAIEFYGRLRRRLAS